MDQDPGLKLEATHKSISPELKKNILRVTSMNTLIKRRRHCLNARVSQFLSSHIHRARMIWTLIFLQMKNLQSNKIIMKTNFKLQIRLFQASLYSKDNLPEFLGGKVVQLQRAIIRTFRRYLRRRPRCARNRDL